MNKNLSKKIIILLIGCILWICHLFDDKLSRYGMYICNNYRLHEIVSIIPQLCVVITAIWFIYNISIILRKKEMKDYIFFSFILLILLATQICYLRSTSKSMVTTEIADIVSINSNGDTVFVNKSNKEMTLQCPEVVKNLLEEDKKYLITYEWRKSNPNKGKLNSAILTK